VADLTPVRPELVEGLRIGFIGAGRLGSALALALQQQGLRVAAVASARAESAQRMAARLPCCESANAQQVADGCDLVFITTPDAAIDATVATLNWRAGTSVVHCSGATEVLALSHAQAAGAATGGFHPMQTFGADPEAAARSLTGCTVTIEAEDAALDRRLVAIAERLGCAVNRLPSGMRARYHAAAGYASQFVNALLADAACVWATWGASEADTVRALLPLVRGTLDAIESAGIARGMPGPVSRGDVSTVAKHMAAMNELGEPLLASYRLLCDRTVPLALTRGGIDAATAERLRGILGTLEPQKAA
jgi:predicted short-subunit dehydrogenase-like oxidoreductase (DUF2520 family)